ncbi:MAG: UDP-N-acetylmuramate dehydrogenase [Dokdonella sp.]
MSDFKLSTAIAEGDGYTIVENASLQGRNTFRVPARANVLIDVRKSSALDELFGYSMLKTQPLLVLGEGSNILFTRDWPGVVLSIVARGITLIEEDSERARVRVEAGENWNDFVRWSLGHGYAGLENLVLIPGSVGAAPIQNIGAYGVEVGEFIVAVEAWDRLSQHLLRIENAHCAFAYRDSLFKQQRDRYVVTAVEFDLPRTRDLHIDYVGVREELALLGITHPTALTVAEAIARLRMRKLPNPALIGNAGSFFKNPLVDAKTLALLRAEQPTLPHWPAGENCFKIPAAWLIEACGLKGFREGDAAVSDQHALVLVNLGNATGAQIGALAKHVQGEVFARFGVQIDPEPRVV